jgi:hypothetical protein
MRKIVLRRFNWPCKTLAAIMCFFLFYLSFGTGPVQALDPNKRLTQYMHTAQRTRDGSLPASMFSVAQTTDGFLWFTSVSQGMYRFDGIRFVPWTLRVDGRKLDHIVSFHGDRAGGLWAVGENEVCDCRLPALDRELDRYIVPGSVRVGTDFLVRLAGESL